MGGFMISYPSLNTGKSRPFTGFLDMFQDCFFDMGVSKNNGTPKSSILIGFSMK